MVITKIKWDGTQTGNRTVLVISKKIWEKEANNGTMVKILVLMARWATIKVDLDNTWG